jgi:hypothetical protein
MCVYAKFYTPSPNFTLAITVKVRALSFHMSAFPPFSTRVMRHNPNGVIMTTTASHEYGPTGRNTS